MSNIILSCNYVSELRELIEEGKVDIDYAKFPAINADMTKLDEAIKIKPVMFHAFPPYDYFLNLCNTDIKHMPVDVLNEIVIKTKTPHISAHINATYDSYPDYEYSEKYNNKILNNAIENIIFIRENINVPFLAENKFMKKVSNDLKVCVEPQFISSLVNESGCRFLFDITHAKIAAQNLDMSFNDYIKHLPMEKIHEIHLSGSEIIDGCIIDKHGKLNDSYYEILEYLLKNTPAKYVTLEYMTKTYDEVNPQYKNEIYECLTRLSEVINKF